MPWDLCQIVMGHQIVPYSWKVPDAILFLSTFIYKDSTKASGNDGEKRGKQD